MNCKFCGAELEENVTVCPACGELVETPAPTVEEAVQTLAKKVRKPMGKLPKAIIAVSLAVVLLLGMAAGALYALGFSYDNWENNLYIKDCYTAPDFVANMTADTVVAKLGDRELTNGMLQLYFGRQLWDLVEEYSDYLTYIGLDLDKSLYEQEFPDGDGATWEQYLLSMALGAWAQQETLVCMAEAENFQYPDGLQTFLDTLEATLNAQAVQYGFKDGTELIRKEMGASANMERYTQYSKTYNYSLEYYAELYESMAPDAQQIETYFDEHADELYEQYYVTKDANPVIDVRHILLIPEETVDEEGNTVTTDEAKAACLQEAEALLEQWKNGEATQESFAALANEYSEDPGSNTNGGLYEYVYQGDMVDSFNDWCFDASRQVGDTGIVETDYGYHIMYFVYGADEWYRVAEQGLRGQMCQDMIAEGYEKYPSEVYFWKIVLSEIEFD